MATNATEVLIVPQCVIKDINATWLIPYSTATIFLSLSFTSTF